MYHGSAGHGPLIRLTESFKIHRILYFCVENGSSVHKMVCSAVNFSWHVPVLNNNASNKCQQLMAPRSRSGHGVPGNIAWLQWHVSLDYKGPGGAPWRKHLPNTNITRSFLARNTHACTHICMRGYVCMYVCVDICIIGTHALLSLHVLLIRKGCAT